MDLKGYGCIHRHPTMKHNLRSTDTDGPGVSKVLGGCRGKVGGRETNRDVTVGVAQFSLTGDISQGSSLGDRTHPLPRWLCI